MQCYDDFFPIFGFWLNVCKYDILIWVLLFSVYHSFCYWGVKIINDLEIWVQFYCFSVRFTHLIKKIKTRSSKFNYFELLIDINHVKKCS